jgi:hypothetical protein
MGRGIAVHLSIDMGGAIGADRREPAQAGRFQFDTVRPNRRQGPGTLPAPTYVVGQPHSARIRQRTTRQAGISDAMLPVLFTHRAGLRGRAESSWNVQVPLLAAVPDLWFYTARP